MEATLYDALNNVANGEITWSASNGTIESKADSFSLGQRVKLPFVLTMEVLMTPSL